MLASFSLSLQLYTKAVVLLRVLGLKKKCCASRNEDGTTGGENNFLEMPGTFEIWIDSFWNVILSRRFPNLIGRCYSWWSFATVNRNCGYRCLQLMQGEGSNFSKANSTRTELIIITRFVTGQLLSLSDATIFDDIRGIFLLIVRNKQNHPICAAIVGAS